MRTLLSTLALLACLSSAHAVNITITEVMSSSSGTAPTNVDWFEITNLDSISLDLTGWKMDDSSAAFATAVALSGVTSLAPGQSAVFMETSSPDTVIPAFRTFWGANASSIVIGSYSGSGVGLSSGGDGVAVFDSAGTQQGSVSFSTATSGTSFGYNTTTQTFGSLSAAGQFGAYAAAGSLTEIGSPGVIPEPSTWAALMGSLVLVLTLYRRSQS